MEQTAVPSPLPVQMPGTWIRSAIGTPLGIPRYFNCLRAFIPAIGDYLITPHPLRSIVAR
jgi:hypothetical protein